MSLDPAAHRRRAALATFTPVLGEDALMDALWMLQDSLHGQSAREIISAVDRVAARHGIDAPTCKRLYEQFYRALSLPDDQLPLDPWPVMQSLRPASAAPMRPAAVAWPAPAPMAAPMAAPMVAPAYAAPVMPPPVAAPVPAPAPALPDAPPAVLVFEALISAALAEVRLRHPGELADLRDSSVSGLDGSRLGASSRNAVRNAWQHQAEAGAWRLVLPTPELGELVHLFYVALCESLGPVDADQVLTRAVREAEQVPAAQRHSPRLFL